jgi:hypothetical protein
MHDLQHQVHLATLPLRNRASAPASSRSASGGQGMPLLKGFNERYRHAIIEARIP